MKNKILQQNSTHKAVENKGNNTIDIWLKGCKFFEIKPELLWRIPIENEEDLFAIFERLDEDNRCLMAELKDEFGVQNKIVKLKQ
jgi:hypothetical protein